jgi:hypothetical protein
MLLIFLLVRSCGSVAIQSICANLYPRPDRDVAERSVLIKNMLEDLGDSGEAIPIPNVSCLTLLLRRRGNTDRTRKG